MAAIVYPDAAGNLHAIRAHGLVTVDIYSNWEKAFAEFQALGRRLGFENVTLHTYKDKRSMSALTAS